jgi:hypothetical protein
MQTGYEILPAVFFFCPNGLPYKTLNASGKKAFIQISNFYFVSAARIPKAMTASTDMESESREGLCGSSSP